MRSVSPIIHAIITARGGSKGIPGKNLIDLEGKPLIAHSIEAALKCSLVSRCFVTTDDPQIAKVSREFGADTIARPAHLAGDQSRSEDAVLHAIRVISEQGITPAIVVLLQPTSPLRTSEHITECLQLFLGTEASSVVSVTTSVHHPMKSLLLEGKHLKPLFGPEKLGTPRSELPLTVRQNGAIYVVNREIFERTRSFFAQPTLAYLMDEPSSVDVDTLFDLELCSFILGKKNQTNKGESVAAHPSHCSP